MDEGDFVCCIEDAKYIFTLKALKIDLFRIICFKKSRSMKTFFKGIFKGPFTNYVTQEGGGGVLVVRYGAPQRGRAVCLLKASRNVCLVSECMSYVLSECDN